MPTDFKSLVEIFYNLVTDITLVLGSLSLLSFFWGITKFIVSAAAGDSKASKSAKDIMIWGVLALFVMVSVWGILRFFYTDAGFAQPFGVPFFRHLQE
jgi:hypothetical protein